MWEDAEKAGCQPDCRMCTVLIEVCTKKGDTMRALNVYQQMCQAPPNSKLSPSVHAYTAAMRAAAEGGQWQRALEIWDDMKQANCRPSGVYRVPSSGCWPYKSSQLLEYQFGCWKSALHFCQTWCLGARSVLDVTDMRSL